MGARLAILCVLAGALVGATGAAPSAREDDAAAAQALLDEGQALFKEGQYGLALGHFERALDRSGVPGIQYLVGRCHQELGNPEQAVRAFEAFLAEAADAPEKVRAKVEGFVAELREQLAAGTVVLSVRPAGAVVRVDGQVVGRAPVAPVSLKGGLHEIEVTHPDYGSVRRTIEVAPHIEQTYFIDVAGVPGPSPPEPPRRDPPPPAPVAPPAAVEPAAVEPAPEPAPAPEPDAPSSAYTPWAWSLLGAGVGVAGAGTIVYVLGELDHQSVTSAEGYDDRPVVGMSQRRATDLESGGDAKKLAGYVLWGVGGAAVVTSVVLFAVDPGAPAGDGAVTVGATPTAGGGLVQVGGRF